MNKKLTTDEKAKLPYDAILLVSFGGPEAVDDVIPFLQNVLRGKNVPLSRMEQVAHHYYKFGGVSPINAHCRALIKSLRIELDNHQIYLPIYWGNRNWHPMLEDTLKSMKADNINNALAFVTSAYSSYSSCRQYREDILRAQSLIDDPPNIDKIRAFYNHPNFIEVNAENLSKQMQLLPEVRRIKAHVAFTAHSIPSSMASNCRYEAQLKEASTLVAQKVGITHWQLVYQSRSGPPNQPWLEPDILQHLKDLKKQNVEDLVIMPLGFVSDHMEVMYDLDTEAKNLGEEIGINVLRAATAGTDHHFIEMVRLLIEERLSPATPKLVIGNQMPVADYCPSDCCPLGAAPMLSGRPTG